MAGFAGPKAQIILLWGVKVLVGLAFLAAAAAKLLGAPMMVQEFGVIGLGQGFRIFTGLVEIAGTGLVLWPKTSFYGGAVLVCVCIGAFFAQVLKLHSDVVHVFVLGALAALIVWQSAPKSALAAAA